MPGEELPDPPLPPEGTYATSTRDDYVRTVRARTAAFRASRSAPPKPPTYAPGDRVIITGSGMSPPSTVGKYGTVTGLHPSDAARYLVDLDDGSKGWFAVRSLEPAPAPATSPWSVGDRVSVRAHGTNPHADAVGTITKFRPPLSTGVRPVSIRLEADCPCGACDGRRHAGTDLLVDETRLVHAPLPALRRGDRVRIVGTSDMAGETGTVASVDADSALPYQVDFDHRPSPAVPHSWFRAAELEPYAPEPTTTTPYTRVLVRLDLPEGEPVPETVTELIDAIAEHHLDVGWTVDT